MREIAVGLGHPSLLLPHRHLSRRRTAARSRGRAFGFAPGAMTFHRMRISTTTRRPAEPDLPDGVSLRVGPADETLRRDAARVLMASFSLPFSFLERSRFDALARGGRHRRRPHTGHSFESSHLAGSSRWRCCSATTSSSRTRTVAMCAGSAWCPRCLAGAWPRYLLRLAFADDAPAGSSGHAAARRHEQRDARSRPVPVGRDAARPRYRRVAAPPRYSAGVKFVTSNSLSAVNVILSVIRSASMPSSVKSPSAVHRPHRPRWARRCWAVDLHRVGDTGVLLDDLAILSLSCRLLLLQAPRANTNARANPPPTAAPACSIDALVLGRLGGAGAPAAFAAEPPVRPARRSAGDAHGWLARGPSDDGGRRPGDGGAGGAVRTRCRGSATVGGAEVVVVGHGCCMTVVKSVPVMRMTSSGPRSGLSRMAPDVRWRATRSAALTEPGAYRTVVCAQGWLRASPMLPRMNPTAWMAAATSAACQAGPCRSTR